MPTVSGAKEEIPSSPVNSGDMSDKMPALGALSSVLSPRKGKGLEY